MRREYLIHAKPVSMNQAYPTNPRNYRRFLCRDGKQYKKLIQLVCQKTDARWGGKLIAAIYFLNIWFEMPHTRPLNDGPSLYLKNGNLRKWDVSNHVKLIEDAVSDYLGVDDSQNFYVGVGKKESADGKVRIRIILNGLNNG